MKNLELNQMEIIKGGCDFPGLADGLSGAALIFGVSSWWTGVGGGISLAIAAAAYVARKAGC
ncbi:hypothetical protein [uncultured Tenacibaculum sp.]|uniref:hypothetical protein n=1 Tax=uncultured Tenacibaculum sp. TaxID=174713 RepID=UPI00262277B3|nr:hypothetical protein [uncultured Tenacibaculum sp.]